MADRPLRDVAKEIGIPVTTLHRLETGQGVDGSTLGAVLIWLMERTA